MDQTPPSAPRSSAHTSSLSQLEAFLEEYLVRKAPFQLPHGLKEFLVKIAPYVIIVTLILTIPILLAAFGLTAYFTPFAMMGGAAYGYGYGWGAMAIISFLLVFLSLILEIMALPGLFKRTYGGWKYLFYAQIVSFVSGLFNGYNGIIGTLLGALIGFYLLFQVKELYTNKLPVTPRV